MMDEHDTPRRSGFAAVFDTDIELLQREVGCPVIDVEGRIRGIAIASRGRNETQRGPTSVLPSHIVSRVTKQLMAEANSKVGALQHASVRGSIEVQYRHCPLY